jgi:hypothetical protein
MITTFIYITIGAFLGWNLPQPQIAKDIQNRVMNWIRNR